MNRSQSGYWLRQLRDRSKDAVQFGRDQPQPWQQFFWLPIYHPHGQDSFAKSPPRPRATAVQNHILSSIVHPLQWGSTLLLQPWPFHRAHRAAQALPTKADHMAQAVSPAVSPLQRSFDRVSQTANLLSSRQPHARILQTARIGQALPTTIGVHQRRNTDRQGQTSAR